jgi:hypothetical protein
MKIITTSRTIAAMAAAAALPIGAACWNAPAPSRTEAAMTQTPTARPALAVVQGHYFRVSMPEGWRFVETTNGFEANAPDGVTSASSAFVINTPGRSNPRAFLEFVLGMLNYPDARIVSWEALPPEPAFLTFNWERGYAEITFTYNGTPVRAGAIVGVTNGFGAYAGSVTAAQAPVAKWNDERAYLMRVAQSAVITNARQIAGLDTVQLPKNIPHDYVFGSYNKSFEARGLSQDRISQARREGMMGYELMESATTGKRYEMPLESYDGTIGGYRNPARPNEILVRPKEFQRR